MKNIAVFDADASIMMGKPLNDGYSQMSELVLYFDDSYIHERVYKEINPSIQKSHLNDLISQGLVSIVNDTTILELLVDTIEDEEVACSFFVSSMVNNLSYMESDERNKLEVLYGLVLNKQYLLVNDLISDLSSIENSMGNDNNCGEFKTSILIENFNFLQLADVNYFVSNDKGARGSIVRQYNKSINTISPIATFVLFKSLNNMSESRARLYLANVGRRGCNEKIKVINESGNLVTKTYLDIFNDIYNENMNIEVTIDGYIKYK